MLTSPRHQHEEGCRRGFIAENLENALGLDRIRAVIVGEHELGKARPHAHDRPEGAARAAKPSPCACRNESAHAGVPGREYAEYV